MGVPVNRLICASNENKVLFDFFQTGKYDRNRDFILTSSPSMDILISSNLERLIYRIAGNNPDTCKAFMDALTKNGEYSITDTMKRELADFVGGYASEEQTKEAIKSLYDKTGYVIDTHTAVASYVCHQYKEKTKDETKTLIASTASPYKFTRSVMNAIDDKLDSMSDFELVDKLSDISKTKVPNAIEEIRTAPVLHDTVCDRTEMKQTVERILGL